MCANASGFTDKGGDWTPATALLPQLGNPTLPREYIIFVVTGGTGRTGAAPTIHCVGIETRPVATPVSTTGGAPVFLQLLLDAAHGTPHIDFCVQARAEIPHELLHQLHSISVAASPSQVEGALATAP